MNIVKELEKVLHDTSMKLVDPNTMAAGKNEEQPDYIRFNRALICIALVGVYKFTRNEHNALEFIQCKSSDELLVKIFNGQLKSIQRRLDTFCHYNPENTREKLDLVLQEILNITRKQLKSTGCTADKVKGFFAMQRAHILSYVPAALHIGELARDNTIDDRTNKMHSPFSDFFHWMEDVLS